eukprot:5824053-Amphidinium_carterae.1
METKRRRIAKLEHMSALPLTCSNKMPMCASSVSARAIDLQKQQANNGLIWVESATKVIELGPGPHTHTQGNTDALEAALLPASQMFASVTLLSFQKVLSQWHLHNR